MYHSQRDRFVGHFANFAHQDREPFPFLPLNNHLSPARAAAGTSSSPSSASFDSDKPPYWVDDLNSCCDLRTDVSAIGKPNARFKHNIPLRLRSQRLSLCDRRSNRLPSASQFIQIRGITHRPISSRARKTKERQVQSTMFQMLHQK